jgi:GxxExxY protein
MVTGIVKKVQRDEQTYAIIGAAMEVHRQLGYGFLETVYQEALAIELSLRNIPFEREVELPVTYKGNVLLCLFRVDFICFDDVLVELKALSALSGIEEAQAINYLKASGFRRSLLINFGAPSLEYKRMVLGYDEKPAN